MPNETPKDVDLLLALLEDRGFTRKQQFTINDLLASNGWIGPREAKERLDGAYVASLPAMEPRMVWQVTYEKLPSTRMGELLADGWEPFAVTTQLDPRVMHAIAVYHLRRQVAAV